jgi:transcriptional regulator
MTSPFVPRDASDVTRLVEAYPLCWVVTGGADNRLATPLPLLPEVDAEGVVDSLLGHIPRAHPQCKALESDPRASILSMGPQGYISPRLVSNLTWGPTWNYASCQFDVEIQFVPDETDNALSRLAEALEGSDAGAWKPEQMGDRYELLKTRIVAFRAHVRATHARFKLGQDENDLTFGEIVGGHADAELADWMRRSRS